MALGAEALKVLWMIMRDALIMVSIGSIVGAGITLMLTRYTESLLFGVKPHDA
jgi:hypothetical protein